MVKTINLVVPCFNEQDVVERSSARLCDLLARLQRLGKISMGSRLILVDDGSDDDTWLIIERLSRREVLVEAVGLSRNYGHQAALLAGLHFLPCDAAISIDADLQDDVNAIELMIDAFDAGYDIVLGVRRSRRSDGRLKRASARSYYRLLQALGVETVRDHADFRLLSARALNALRLFDESNLYLRGIVLKLGFRSTCVYYDRLPREAGTSKYNLRRMLGLAVDGVTSLSVAPLRAISALGFVIFVCSLLGSLWALVGSIVGDSTLPGWASTVLPIYFLGGVQLLALGAIGEYLAKVYTETKRRPRYLIQRSSQEPTPVVLDLTGEPSDDSPTPRGAERMGDVETVLPSLSVPGGARGATNSP